MAADPIREAEKHTTQKPNRDGSIPRELHYITLHSIIYYILLSYTILYYIILYYLISYYAIRFRARLLPLQEKRAPQDYITLYSIIFDYIILYYIIFYYILLYYTILYYIMLSYIILCDSIAPSGVSVSLLLL